MPNATKFLTIHSVKMDALYFSAASQLTHPDTLPLLQSRPKHLTHLWPANWPSRCTLTFAICHMCTGNPSMQMGACIDTHRYACAQVHGPGYQYSTTAEAHELLWLTQAQYNDTSIWTATVSKRLKTKNLIWRRTVSHNNVQVYHTPFCTPLM